MRLVGVDGPEALAETSCHVQRIQVLFDAVENPLTLETLNQLPVLGLSLHCFSVELLNENKATNKR